NCHHGVGPIGYTMSIVVRKETVGAQHIVAASLKAVRQVKGFAGGQQRCVSQCGILRAYQGQRPAHRRSSLSKLIDHSKAIRSTLGPSQNPRSGFPSSRNSRISTGCVKTSLNRPSLVPTGSSMEEISTAMENLSEDCVISNLPSSTIST